MSDELLLTPGQYDLLTVDKPEKRRRSPLAAQVLVLHSVFGYAADRTLYIAAGKLHADQVGAQLLELALKRLCQIPHFQEYITKMATSPVLMVPRISQAAAQVEVELHPLEPVSILLELRARRARNQEIEQRLVSFMQDIHTASPIMRKYIKSASELVMRAAFSADPQAGADLVDRALVKLSADSNWLDYQRKTCRVPKDTAQKLIQMIAKARPNGN